MNQLTKVFEGHQVRVVGTPDQPLFVLADICEVLEIGNPSDVKKRLEDGVVSIEGISDKFNRTQRVTVINEDGLYDVVLDSRKPIAKKFRKWVTSEVLPAIRQDGGYIVATAEQTTEEIMARAVLVANKALERIQKERDQIASEKEALLHSGKLYTSTEIAKELGLRSATALNQLLGDNKIQYRVNKTWVLSAKYADKGYTSIKQHVLDNGRTVYDRKWTGVGRDFLIQKFSLQVETA